MPDSYDFLRQVPLFADLPQDDLQQICGQLERVRIKSGDVLFEEGSLGQHAYIIKEGQLEVYKTSNGRSVQLAVRGPGEVIGEISFLESDVRTASVRALSDVELLCIGHDKLELLLNSSPTAARTMLQTVIGRLRSTELLLRQSEKMAQLGTLMAGIAHELNNPAAAVRRGADQMKAALVDFYQCESRLHALGLSTAAMQKLEDLEEKIRLQAQKASRLDALSRADREEAFEEWFAQKGLDDSWELAAQLVELGFAPNTLEPLAVDFTSEQLPVLLHWMAAAYNVNNLLEEIGNGAARMSEIISALKTYVYLDQAPMQEVDLHEGLENTLIILRHKLKDGIQLERFYGEDVPRIQAYGSELNQVWTNIIDNAIDAMDGHGRLQIRTQKKDDWVVVEIENEGPEIPADVRERLFTPFFTTKAIGKGTGLGLSISYNIVHKHGGDIKVKSQAGKTCFEVWLPANSTDQQE